MPTEAEWEYAARAHSITAYSWGPDLGVGRANCFDCEYRWAGRSTVPVGSFEPNDFGLYDMHGNVWEWCQDWYGPYDKKSLNNPTGPKSGVARVVRGGSWYDNGQDVRSALRLRLGPDNRHDGIGFRLAQGQ